MLSLCGKINNIISFKNTSDMLQILKFVYLLIFITQSCNSVTINDLTFVCNTEAKHFQIDVANFPSYCITISTYINNLETESRIFKNKGDRKTIVYITGYKYSEWPTAMKDTAPFTEFIKRENLDGLIFDNMHTDKDYNKEVNEGIMEFFKNLKMSNPKTLFGLALPRHAKALPSVFNYNILDSVVDFYSIHTQAYRRCKHKWIMKESTTQGDMKKSLEHLKKAIPNSMYKVLLTVELVVQAVNDDNKVEILPYRNANLCSQFKMLGVIVENSILDDNDGSCGCIVDDTGDTLYPGLKTISDGSKNIENKKLTDCETFGNKYKD